MRQTTTFEAVRPATAADLAAFYGEPPAKTVRAIVGMVDGEPAGIGGTYHSDGMTVLFCRLTPEAKRKPVLLHKVALDLIRGARERGGRLVAVASPNEPTADRWLRRLGFEPAGRCDQGDLYAWKP